MNVSRSAEAAKAARARDQAVDRAIVDILCLGDLTFPQLVTALRGRGDVSYSLPLVNEHETIARLRALIDQGFVRGYRNRSSDPYRYKIA